METSRHITVSELSVVVRTSSGNAQEVRPARVLGPGVNSVLRRTIIRSHAGRTTGLQTGLTSAPTVALLGAAGRLGGGLQQRPAQERREPQELWEKRLAVGIQASFLGG